jgi:hypothetical protein
VTRNIVLFLDHIRSKDTIQRLWFRDVCLNHKDEDEKTRFWNQEWMDTMIQHAEKMIDLSEVIAELWDKGELPRPFPQRPKQWNVAREAHPTKHHPAPLHMQKGFVEPPPPHEYLPLDYVCDEYRHIALWKADNYDDPLVASLAHSVMNDEVTYHALSYTRGPTEELANCPILLNGQTFMIRQELDKCLRDIRHDVYEITIWVDMICIDMNNAAERNRHIPRMLEIYEGADVVISWAGEADDASDTAFDLLDELKSPKLHPDEDGNWGPYTVKEGDTWKITPIPDLPRRLAALYRFFSRWYFRRIWVIQEIAVANFPSIYCGKKRAAWSDLDRAAYHLTDILNRNKTMSARMLAADPTLKSVSYKTISFVRRLFYFRHLRSKNVDFMLGHITQHGVKDTSPGILDLLVMCRDFECTSPYDKVFALLNIAEDIEGMDFKPDYSKTLSQTYQDFAVAVAQKTESLDILSAAEPSTAEGLEVPSWCPDWSTPAKISSLIRHDRVPNIFMTAVQDVSGPIYNACGPPTLTPRFDFKGPVLEVAGIILDTVKIVQQLQPNETNPAASFMEWMTTAFNECQTQEEKDLPPVWTPFMDKFWSMLAGDSAGVWSTKPLPREDSSPEIGGPKEKENVPFQPTCIKEDQTRFFMYDMSADVFSLVTKGRALIITENGSMGLAPSHVEVGQKLAILSKCSVPVLLQENEDGTYIFKGSCFVQGWMEGEVLEEMGLDSEEAWQLLDDGGRLRIV